MFVASVVLLGTTGLVQNVFVPFMVWFPEVLTTFESSVARSCATSYTCFSVAIAVPVFVAVDVLFGTTGEVENVFVPAIVWSPDVFTTFWSSVLSSSATSYTCFSVAGFVPSFVAALVLFGNTGSVVNVFTPDIVWFVFTVTNAPSTHSSSSCVLLVAKNLN